MIIPPRARCARACPLEVALAILVGLLAAAPFLMLHRGGTITRQVRRRHDTGTFILIGWSPAPGLRGRLGTVLGLRWIPALWNILRGELAWTGPRPLTVSETVPPDVLALRALVLPGLCSLWALRQNTNIDFDNEWACDREQIAMRSLRSRAGLLLRCAVTQLYGRSRQTAVDGRTLVDTVRVDSLSADSALDVIDQRLSQPAPGTFHVTFVNPDCVNIARRDIRYRAAVNAAGLALPDGIGMLIAGQLLGRPFRQNVNGTDLFPRLCERLARRNGSLYLLGARPGVAASMAVLLEKDFPALRILGARDGYFSDAECPAILADIRHHAPDVLLVAMGAPLQERWIETHQAELGVPIAMGVGGLFDFYSRRIPRAPQWLRELGLEWTFRLWCEPGRMWRRYLLGNFRFLLSVVLQKLLGSTDSQSLNHVPGPTARLYPNAQGILMAMTSSDPLMRQAGLNSAVCPLGGRSVLTRTLETLVDLGCKHIHVFADDQIALLRTLLGEGERWGCRVEVHAVAGLRQALDRIASMDFRATTRIWWGQADRWLPRQAFAVPADEALWIEAGTVGERWAGWACLRPDSVAKLIRSLRDARNPATILQLGLPTRRTSAVFRLDRADSALEAHRRWLTEHAGAVPLLPEIRPGIYQSPSARVAPDAELRAPVAIEAGVIIGPRAVVGPHVSLGTGTWVESGAQLQNTVVLRDVYIGPDVEIRDALVSPQTLISVRWQTCLNARLTRHVSGAVSTTRPARTVPFSERLCATLLWVCCGLPAAVLRTLGSRRHFTRTFAPGLPAVILGRHPLVGVVRPDTLPLEVPLAGWRHALEAAPSGLLSPSLVFGAQLADNEARTWADIHWLAHQSWGIRMKLLWTYFCAELRPQPTRAPVREGQSSTTFEPDVSSARHQPGHAQNTAPIR